MINGYATSSATSDWANRHADLFYGSLGQTKLRVSQAGFGGYRISNAVPAHGKALQLAIESGVNVIDTSANYADGGSEMLIGEVLAKLISAARLRREEVVVVSKAGYLQGNNYERSQVRRRRGAPFPELVPYANGLEHCIHPDFLEDQLNRSLERLGLKTLDVYLLHNPEYFLGWAANQGQHPELAQTAYVRRIEKAFRYLETEVANGRIRCYGISSNTFPVNRTDPQHTCLETIWRTAVSISPTHHFQIIQLPMNLLETGAVLLANQPSGMTALAFARQKTLGVLINRPLNAFTGKRLVRLADVKDFPRLTTQEIRSKIAALRRVETEFTQQILPVLALEPSVQARLESQLLIADGLERTWPVLQGYEHWRQVQQDMLLPRVRGVLAFLETQSAARRQINRWRGSYQQTMEAALQAIAGHYVAAAIREVARIKALLAQADPDWSSEGSLSRLALRALRSTAGISCVLVGMRKKEYVEEVVAELQRSISVRDRNGSWASLGESTATII